MPLALHIHKQYTTSRAAFHGVLHPTTLEETGSDQHRAYLSRLCCAFRLSQPLDALLHPQPSPPCFMRVTPLGLNFQRFSLPGSGDHLTMTSCPHAVFRHTARDRQAGISDMAPRLQGLAHPGSPYRQARCYPWYADRSSPSLLPLRGFHPSGLGLMLP